MREGAIRGYTPSLRSGPLISNQSFLEVTGDTEARAVHFPAADWGGGVHPYRAGHRKLGMWLFIVSDSLTFSALLLVTVTLRASNVWPTPFPFYPSIVFASVMTFCLLSSSLTMVFGVSASSRGDKQPLASGSLPPWLSASRSSCCT